MPASKEILDYLTQPDNLKLALEMSEHLDELKRKTHQDFWVYMNQDMKRRIAECAPGSQWTFMEFPVRRLRSNWEKSYIVPILRNPSTPYLSLALGQATSDNNFHLMWGVQWNNNSENFEHPALTQLKGMVIACGASTVELPKWLGWSFLPYIPFTHNYIHQMYSNKVAFIHEISEFIWNAFTKLQPLMDEVNMLRISEKK